MKDTLQRLLAILFPQRNLCHACGALLAGGEGLLCEVCVRELRQCAFTPARAGTVLDGGVEAYSAFAYTGCASALVKALKFGADYTAALPLAEGMAGLLPRRRPCCMRMCAYPCRYITAGFAAVAIIRQRCFRAPFRS